VHWIEVEWLLCGPKMANCKSGGMKKDTMIGWIEHVLHHLSSLLGAIDFTVLCAFIFRVWYFDAQIR
jgi:hypothetical protein